MLPIPFLNCLILNIINSNENCKSPVRIYVILKGTLRTLLYSKKHIIPIVVPDIIRER